MNVVREINKINERELDLGISGSWHDDYKDSAYIFAGGLHKDLTEGDVITIFSQYGEVMDINMPRDKETGKQKGFAFLMYEDQRSTVLAVDNLNGAQVLDRTLRVDHVKNYKQPKTKDEDGEWQEPEAQSLNAKPPVIVDDGDAASESSDDSGPEIDPEDPMAEYLLAQRKEEKAAKKGKKAKSKRKHKDETPEERQARKERRRLKKDKKSKSAGVAAVEGLLKSLGGDRPGFSDRRRSPSPRRPRSRTRTPPPARGGDRDRYPARRSSRSRERSPPRRRSLTPPYRSRHENEDRRLHRRSDDSPPRARRGYDSRP